MGATKYLNKTANCPNGYFPFDVKSPKVDFRAFGISFVLKLNPVISDLKQGVKLYF